MAGFTHWAAPRNNLCTWCSTTTHRTCVQGALTACSGSIPAAWRERYFRLFPVEWDVAAWFTSPSATYDDRRRFLRTLAPRTLIDYLRNKGIKTPEVRKAWQKTHESWLRFWITEKRFLADGPRPMPGGGSAQQARTAAARTSRISHTKFRQEIMGMDDVAESTSVRQCSMADFLSPPLAPQAAAHAPGLHHPQPP